VVSHITVQTQTIHHSEKLIARGLARYVQSAIGDLSPPHCSALCNRCDGGSQVLIVITNRHVLSSLQLRFVLRNQGSIDLDLRSLRELTNELKVWLIREASSQPQERLLEVVIAPGA